MDITSIIAPALVAVSFNNWVNGGLRVLAKYRCYSAPVMMCQNKTGGYRCRSYAPTNIVHVELRVPARLSNTEFIPMLREDMQAQAADECNKRNPRV